MNSPPCFSIVIPTFNRRNTVRDSVLAVSRIDYPGSVELIVVDDGSTDGTEEALSELQLPFPFQVLTQANSGAAAARNRGARQATGEILLFLDDDMMAAPDLLRRHAASYAAGADAVLGHIPLDPGSPDTFLACGAGKWAEIRRERLSQGGELDLFDLLTGQLSVRRSLFEELGGFDTDFTTEGAFGDEDIDFGVRLVERAHVVFNPEAISFQHYIVAPRDYLRQWRQAGEADVLFARKHPSYSARIFELHGSASWLTRLVLRPLARLAFVPSLFARLATRIADWEPFIPKPLRRLAVLQFAAARDLVYWSGVHDARRRTRASGAPAKTVRASG